MGWLITFGVLFLIAITPVGVRFRYNSEGTLLAVILGPFRLTILPAKKKKPKKEKKSKEPKKKEEKPTSKPEPGPVTDPPPAPKPPKQKKEKGGSLLDFLPLVKVALDFLGGFRRGLRINHLELKLIMAGDDPCDLATNYGNAWAALGNLLPQLERAFVIKKRDIEIECDFFADQTLVIAGLDLTITIGRILSLLVVTAYRGIREFLKIKKKRKGGAAK